MIVLGIIAGYILLGLIAIRIAAAYFFRSSNPYGPSSSLDPDDWFAAIVIGIFWPLTILYPLWRFVLVPLVTPGVIRRAARANRARVRQMEAWEAEYRAKKAARENSLPFPEVPHDR